MAEIEQIPGTSPFVGESEMAGRCRSIDWANTPLGSVDEWPLALRTAVRMAIESPFPINLWCGPRLQLIYNDAYTRLLGAKHPRALGRPGEEVWNEIWPQIGSWFDAIRMGGPPVYAEDARFLMERAHGPPEEAWFTFSLSPVRDERGAVVAFLNIASETTNRILADRRTSEARAAAERAEMYLREVFAQAPAFMAVLDGPNHVFDFVNDAYSQLIGHRDVVGKSIRDALPEIAEQGFFELLDEVMRTGVPYIGRAVPVMLQRKPGEALEERFVDFVYQPLTDSTGKRFGIVAHGSDVTESVIAQAAVIEANRAKSAFLAAMSHELRTPLNAIGGYAQLIEMGVRGPVTEEQRIDLLKIQRSKNHLDALVSDVLSFAKLGSGKIEYTIRDVHVQQLLNSVVEMVTPQLVEKDLALEPCVVAADLAVRADPDKVRQILLNLVANALKFTPPEGTIAFGVKTTNADVLIDVCDTGIGIPPDHLERIFEPFVQSKRALRPGDQGVGLGLAISRQLARAMQGELTVRSTLGEGSTFTVCLPRAK